MYSNPNTDFFGNDVKQHCSTCIFNSGSSCIGHGTRRDNHTDTYGMSIMNTIKMFPTGCERWQMSASAYCNLSKFANNVL